MTRPRLIARRQVLAAGLASAGGLILGGCSRPVPPTYGSLLRLGDNLTYLAHRVLLPGESLVKEYSRADLSSFPAVGTTDPVRPAYGRPASEAYREWQQGGFGSWRLPIEGLVSRPAAWSIAELKAMPSRTQITRHVCEEGWSAIGEWTGVPLSRVLDAAGLQPSAQFVTFHSVDGTVDSIDLLDALHPQTLLAYGMNGQDLPIPHGAPLRLRVERQVGYKSMKYLSRIVVSDHLDDGGDLGNPKNGWAWYVGI
jgi:DMSO/TMAO reductase YedYZ molybdopterin-dependent catalytic subunit